MSKFSLYEQNYDASKAYVVALLVNPKTGVIQLATTGYVKKTPLRSAPASARRLVPNLDECVLVDMDGSIVGIGEIDSVDDVGAKASGLPRAHTYDGVISTGEGTGSVLYSALAALNKLRLEGLPEDGAMGSYGIDKSSEGISSYRCYGEEYASRTPSASRWWDSANSKHCMTVRATLKHASFGDCVVDAYYYKRAVELGIVAAIAKGTHRGEDAFGANAGAVFGLAGQNSAKRLVGANWGRMRASSGSDRLLGSVIEILRSEGELSAGDEKSMVGRFEQGIDEPPTRNAKDCDGAVVTGFKRRQA